MTIISHFVYYYIVSKSEKIRLRVMIFAKKSSRFQFCQKLNICSNIDILIININDFMNSNTEIIQLINVYNEKSLAKNSNEWTIKKSLKNIISHLNIIICEDFNSYHS